MRNFSISFLLTGIILTVVYKNNHEVSASDKLIKQLYELSADTISLNSGAYFLEPFLCRNTPLNDDEITGNRIMALIYLVDAGNQSIPTNFHIKNLYVVNKKYIWSSSVSESATQFLLTKIGAENPYWQTNDSVDIIAEIVDSVSNHTHLVIARNQKFSDF
ncbi:MAG TPA: hypothetical protein VHO46_13950 [Bacteroidales bacterium]|nr:hypothetical protein [Bacteroidales bacterium]